MRDSPFQGRLPYNPQEETLGVLILPMFKKSRNAIFWKEKAAAGCSLLTQSLSAQEMTKKHTKVIRQMSKISRNAVFTNEKAPAGCSKLAKGL